MRGPSIAQRLGLVLLGVLAGLAMLEAGLRFGGRIYLWRQARYNEAALQRKDSVRIICLGESTTAFGGDHSYPRELERVLNEQGSGRTFSVVNLGIPGINTDRILRELDANLAYYEPNIVVAMMGINDAGQLEEADSGLANLAEWLRIARLAGHISDGMRTRFGGDRKSADARRAARAPRDIAALEDRSTLERHVAAHPDDAAALARLASAYVNEDDEQSARWALEKAFALQPANLRTAYLLVAMRSRLDGTSEADAIAEIESVLRQIAERDPSRVDVRNSLARLAIDRRRYSDARSILEAVEAEGIGDVGTRELMVRTYENLSSDAIRDGRLDDAEALVDAAMRLTPESSWSKRADLHGRLAAIAQLEQDHRSVDEHLAAADELRRGHVNPRTRKNYRDLAARLRDRGIPLVAVQYPLRELSSLEAMLSERDGVVFVDNEAVFRDALRRAPYDDIFIDQFAGDFGHLSRKGARLLAENVAQRILADVLAAGPGDPPQG